MRTLPETIGLIGDVHGNMHFAKKAIRELTARGAKQLHFLGDFGFVWQGGERQNLALKPVELALKAADVEGLVHGGNHDGYEEWEKVPEDEEGLRWARKHIALLPRGWRATSPAGVVFASLGGANSIDVEWRRQRGAGWWPQEQITEADLAALGTEKADVLLGHDAPMSDRLVNRLARNEHLWINAGKGLAYAKSGQAMYHRGFLQVRPRLTVSGHYHMFVDTTQQYTTATGETFTSRSVVLNYENQYPSLALLNTNTLEMRFIQTDQTE